MPNRLAQESSPYLLQHANNPVDWYPWGPAALEKARAEDKPILLSIGYSTCHWCHVMARECFEDAEVAEVMNRLFVSIKVDREERPDLDQIYQTAHQIFAQRGGGWPLTMFLTPDQLPFYAGTYFPKHARHNLPGFVQLMQQVERAYRERRQDIEAQNQQLLSALAQNEPAASGDAQFDSKPLDAARAQLAQSFDPRWGGFSKAPKFPRPAELEFLLRQTSDEKARGMALFTLERMLRGGLIDQLGGGFYRYSVDERWAIPHFEKMLYDNGPLLGLMADAWALTGDAIYSEAAQRTVDWLATRNDGTGWCILFGPGCGLRARGRQVLRLDAGRSARVARRRAVGGGGAGLGTGSAGQFRSGALAFAATACNGGLGATIESTAARVGGQTGISPTHAVRGARQARSSGTG